MKVTEEGPFVELTGVDGRTLRDILRLVRGLLRADGPRALTTTTKNGAVIHASLYDGEDYMLDAAGRLIYQS